MSLFAIFVQSLNNSSVVVKSSCIAVVVFYLVGLIPQAYSFLSITPSLLLPPNFQIWTLITGLVVERSIINVVINVPLIILCGQHLEPLWGALELLKFISITSVGTALMTSLISLAAFAVTHRYAFWTVQFSGMAGVIGGLSVAFKQIIPDQKLNAKIGEIRVHDCPMLALLVFTLLAVVHVFSYTQPIMLACGVIVGWTYLRFYQSHGKGMRGDMGDHFAVATLLPKPCRPAASFLSNGIYHVVTRIGLCKKPVRTYDVGGPSSITISLPGSDPADAERRRKKALRALNERLVQMQQKTPSNESLVDSVDDWPDLEQNSNNIDEGTGDIHSEDTENFEKEDENDEINPSS